MYNFIIDSDGLIKLTHSGAIQDLCKAAKCIITEEVKKEVVDKGIELLYQDAEKANELIKKKLLLIQNPKKKIELNNLGKGELSVLSLAKETKNNIIISDDKAFIKELESRNMDFLIPIDVIVFLWKTKKIDTELTLLYLDKIKAFVNEKEYKAAKKNVEE